MELSPLLVYYYCTRILVCCPSTAAVPSPLALALSSSFPSLSFRHRTNAYDAGISTHTSASNVVTMDRGKYGHGDPPSSSSSSPSPCDPRADGVLPISNCEPPPSGTTAAATGDIGDDDSNSNSGMHRDQAEMMVMDGIGFVDRFNIVMRGRLRLRRKMAVSFLIVVGLVMSA